MAPKIDFMTSDIFDIERIYDGALPNNKEETDIVIDKITTRRYIFLNGKWNFVGMVFNGEVLTNAKKRRVVGIKRKPISLNTVLEFVETGNISDAKSLLVKFIEKHGSEGVGSKRQKRVSNDGEKILSPYNLFVQKALNDLKTDGNIPGKERMKVAMAMWRAHKAGTPYLAPCVPPVLSDAAGGGAATDDDLFDDF
jgi:hypothetical protein